MKKKTKVAIKHPGHTARDQAKKALLQSHWHNRLSEVIFLISIALALFSWIALFSYHQSDSAWSHTSSQLIHSKNVAGQLGAWLADVFLYFLGYLGYLLPLAWCYGAWLVYQHTHNQPQQAPPLPGLAKFTVISLRTIGLVSIIVGGSSLLNITLLPLTPLPYTSGGAIGASIAQTLVHYCNYWGAILIALFGLLLGFTLFTGLSWMRFTQYTGAWVLRIIHGLWRSFCRLQWRHLWTGVVRLFQRTVKSKPVEIVNTTVAKVSHSVSSNTKPQPTPKKSPLKIVTPAQASQPTASTAAIEQTLEQQYPSNQPFNQPKLSLLHSPNGKDRVVIDARQLEHRSREVELRLADFGIQAEVTAVHPGPVVTRYELQLAAGTKVSKIVALVKDLARSLSVTSARIVEVIPGKSVIGLELPNDQIETVYLQEVLTSEAYQKSASALTIALGKDIAGQAVIADLAKMPHLLVAGTTGSGKSVSLNTILLSLLYKSSPRDLRLILIDPKMLELSIYEGIPHLLTPVVTDMKDASTALRWCVMEMERRYRIMAALKVRNIAGYNTKIQEAIDRGQPLTDPFHTPTDDNEPPSELQALPKIVVIADEFADMMVVVGKKVETLIARLAQKARAAGIHLILATQRPSVDVITGLIKANIPARIAFQVSSKVDSRTILDQQGADQLLGNGDMLYLPPGTALPVRVHGAFVDDHEVLKVTSYLKQQGKAEYIDSVLAEDEQSPDDYLDSLATGQTGEQADGEQDALYDQAVEMVVRSRRVSVSAIQRRFKIGFNRAARIVETMEAAGIVSGMGHNGNREVLIPDRNDS